MTEQEKQDELDHIEGLRAERADRKRRRERNFVPLSDYIEESAHRKKCVEQWDQYWLLADS